MLHEDAASYAGKTMNHGSGRTLKVSRLSIAVFLLAAGSGAAEPLLEPTATPFAERLTDRVPVSGRTLVGLLSVLTNQPPNGAGLETKNMAVPAFVTTEAVPVCVRATTQDGRYSAQNSFVAQGPLPKTGRVDLDWPTAYQEALSSFPLREVAVLARRGSCDEHADLIPVMLGEGDALGILQALVNTRGGAVTAVLRDPEAGKTLKRVNCTRVSGTARVAFDARCVLGSAADLPPRVQLRLEQVSRDGLQTEVLEDLILQLTN
ncbi:MAG: hypothetical protein ACRYG6_07685 [Janthinobacterium lividum]